MKLLKTYTNEATDAFYQNKLWAVVHAKHQALQLVSASLIGGALNEYKNPVTVRNWGFTTVTANPVDVTSETLLVLPHTKFQVWVGVDPKYTREQMKQILASDNVGTLVLSPGGVIANKITLKVF